MFYLSTYILTQVSQLFCGHDMSGRNSNWQLGVSKFLYGLDIFYSYFFIGLCIDTSVTAICGHDMSRQNSDWKRQMKTMLTTTFIGNTQTSKKYVVIQLFYVFNFDSKLQFCSGLVRGDWRVKIEADILPRNYQYHKQLLFVKKEKWIFCLCWSMSKETGAKIKAKLEDLSGQNQKHEKVDLLCKTVNRVFQFGLIFQKTLSTFSSN